MKSLKAEGEEWLGQLTGNQLKGKLLPYQQLSELVPRVERLLDSDEYADLESAVRELKEYLTSASEKAVYEYDKDGLKFSFEVAYSEEDGIPVLTYTFNDSYRNYAFDEDKNDDIAIAMSTICHSSPFSPEVERMVSYNGLFFTKTFAAYCGDKGDYYIDKPQLARCEIDENTYKVKVCTPEQKEILLSDSETFINSDGVETKRDNGETGVMNYITILEQDPSNFESGNCLADRLTWIVLL